MIIEGFAGPGGWAVAADRLGLSPHVGIEIDAAACATRVAAGHITVRADISSWPAERLAGKVTGAIFSPVCTTFSAAGKRGGVAVTDVLDALIRDLLEGGKTRAAHRREMARLLTKSWWPDPKLTRTQRSVAIWKAVRSASLVAEPARFIWACRPEWVAMEQVPSVLSLWQAYAQEMRKLGYSVWTGKLNAADYGVPQTRERAILIASRVRSVQRPYPTHYDPRKGEQMFGERWVSMAEALGMGATARPSPTVTAGGTATGGAEPFGHRDRDALAREQEAGRWLLATNRGQAEDGSRLVRDPRSAPAPAPALTAKSGLQWVLQGPYRDSPGDRTRPRTMDEPSTTVAFGHSSMILRRTHAGVPEGDGEWVLHRQTGKSAEGDRPDRTLSEPAPTITGGGSAAGSGNGAGLTWRFRNNNNNNACERSLDEPAGPLFFGHRSNWAAWVAERPATTIQGDPRVGRPGHKDRDKGEAQFAVDSVRISVEEAAALQSFPPGYPWRGTKTAQYTQVGNACPPLMMIPVLGEAAGIPWEEIAAAYRAELSGQEQAA